VTLTAVKIPVVERSRIPCEGPHRWFVPSRCDNWIYLSTCLVCSTHQYQPHSRDKLEEANRLNALHGYPLIVIAKRDKREGLDFDKLEKSRRGGLQNKKEENMDNIGTIPPKPVKRSPLAFNRYYRENRDAIMADIEKLGKDGTKKKWGIRERAYQTLTGNATKPPKVAKESKPATKPPIVEKGGKPALPTWNESWSNEVRLEWLKCWQVGKN
jgi:hypothetical protein